MLYHFEKGWKAAQLFGNLNELFGKGTIGECQCREWFARFKLGDISLENKSVRGRSSDFDDPDLLAAVEEDESLTTRMLAEDFKVNQSTVVRRLIKLGKVWKIAGWIPHELSDNKISDRFRIFTKLLQGNEQTPPGICFNIRHIHRPKHLRTIMSTTL
ncbi:histone-lysine N-methyltransferase SETMAR [Trichonephila inaurata madagascariensis]|uniref:Histone-lysine N-methyltransferase SETMAR n=1 Tax=Trichonephila inaurata madagascariensis TaxID=2747483 RepID=A0A8X7CAR0_9ARAC|nr:histone-lysine N-methyltransferase SETMAR [Trichonephila inaurata madagascariensis]